MADLDRPPKELVTEACARYGTDAVARWCADLLLKRAALDDPDLTLIGGRHAAAELARGGLARPGQEYWPRVWAARALRYAWTPAAAPAVVAALDDPAWRVREMAAKVVAQRELGEAGDALAPLVLDGIPRVRAAAVTALGAVGEAEHADAVHAARDDPEPAVRAAADAALARLRRRLDREV